MAKPVLKITTKNGKSATKAVYGYINLIYGQTSAILTYTTSKMVSIAQKAYSTAMYDGINDVVVRFVPNSKATGATGNLIFKVVAESPSGNALYIEFGAGKHYNGAGSNNPFIATATPTPDGIGMHSTIPPYKPPSKGQRDAWVYYGNAGTNGIILGYSKDNGYKVLTYGNPPARAMFQARQYAERTIISEFKNRFKNFLKK